MGRREIKADTGGKKMKSNADVSAECKKTGPFITFGGLSSLIE